MSTKTPQVRLLLPHVARHDHYESTTRLLWPFEPGDADTSDVGAPSVHVIFVASLYAILQSGKIINYPSDSILLRKMLSHFQVLNPPGMQINYSTPSYSIMFANFVISLVMI